MGSGTLHHAAEPAAEEGRLTLGREIDKRVAFHDPCYLGRHSSNFEAPRELLAGVVRGEPVVLEREREASLCCAGGGGRIWAEVPVGERFGEMRIRDALAAGADVLATSCPYCVNMLTDACKSLEQQDSLAIVECVRASGVSVAGKSVIGEQSGEKGFGGRVLKIGIAT